MAKLLKFWLNAIKCPHCANLHLFIAHDRNAEVQCFSLAYSERLKSEQGLLCLPPSLWLLVPFSWPVRNTAHFLPFVNPMVGIPDL